MAKQYGWRGMASWMSFRLYNDDRMGSNISYVRNRHATFRLSTKV